MYMVGSDNFYIVINGKNICIGKPQRPHPTYYTLARDAKELCVLHSSLTEIEELLHYSAQYLNGERPAAGKITASFFVVESHDNVAATLFIGAMVACTRLEPFIVSPTLMV